jgi:hypothetical protein
VLQVTPNLPASAGQSLNDLAEQIRTEHQAGVVSLVEHGMNAGDLLKKAKAEIGSGNFEDWVEDNCKMSYRTARVYMQLADNRAVLEAKLAALLPPSFSPAHPASKLVGPSIRDALKLISVPKLKPAPEPEALAIAPATTTAPVGPEMPVQMPTANAPAAPASWPKKNIVAGGQLIDAWKEMPLGARRHFIDAVGLKDLLDAIPEAWVRHVEGIIRSDWNYQPAAWHPIDRDEPAPAPLGDDDLSIPACLRREPAPAAIPTEVDGYAAALESERVH